MKRFSLILSAVLFAISISANAFQNSAKMQALTKAEKSLVAKSAVNGLNRAPQQKQAMTVTAEEFAPGIGLIKFETGYPSYKETFSYQIQVYESGADEPIDFANFDYMDGDLGVTTFAIIGDTLPVGVYDIYVFSVLNGKAAEMGQAALTIAHGAGESLPSISNVKAVNSEDLSTTTISWSQSGTWPEGGYTTVQVYCSGDEVFNSLTDPKYGKAVVSPVTVSLEKDKDYFIYVSGYLHATDTLNQYVAFDYAQHSVGVNPFTPENLQAVVDGTEVTFTWASHKADSIPASTVFYLLSKDSTKALGQMRIYHTGEDAEGQTLTVTLAEESTYCWGVRPVSANSYYITPLQYGQVFTTGKDNKKPVIDSVKTGDITTTSIELLVFAQDNYSDEDSLVFTVKNGETELLKAKADDGVLVLEGLTINTEYNLSIIATDEAGNASEPFAIKVKTSNDQEAPVISKAALKKAIDHRAYIEVAATDNETAAEDIVFIVTVQGAAEPIEMSANNGVLVIGGLTESTAYSLTVAAKDKSGNVSAASEAIAFTTTAHTPITLEPKNALAYYLGSNAYGYNFFQLNLYGPASAGYLPDIYLTIVTEQATKISGTYTSATGFLMINAGYTNVLPDEDVPEPLAITAGQVALTFTEYKTKNGVDMPAYNFAFAFVDEDGVEYNGTLAGARTTTYNTNDQQIQIVTGEGQETVAVENIESGVKAIKRIENGQLIIEQNGVQYNVLGVTIK